MGLIPKTIHFAFSKYGPILRGESMYENCVKFLPANNPRHSFQYLILEISLINVSGNN